MTAIKCQRCARYWSMCHNSPDIFLVIQRFCPDCIPAILPRMGDAPVARRTA